MIDKCSDLQRYEREFLHRRKSVKEQWEENTGRINLLEELYTLPTVQLEILAMALENIMEYRRWDYLLSAADITENLNL